MSGKPGLPKIGLVEKGVIRDLHTDSTSVI